MLRPETTKIQHIFAEYCRTGDPVEIPGTVASRLHHYHRLVYNVVNNTMEQAFPITFKVMKKEEWDEMIDQFYRYHDCQTPKIWELPREFYQFIRDKNFAEKYNKPYLNDLLYFEWVEIEVHSMPDNNPENVAEIRDLLTDPLVINHESRIIRLEYPAHKYPAEQTKDKKGNYFVLIFRVPETGNVRFIDLSILHIVLLQQMETTQKPVVELFDDIAQHFNISADGTFRVNISKFLKDMILQQYILGYVRN